MVETANKMRVGESLAGRMFKFFGWTQHKATNQNWGCEDTVTHNTEITKVHTTDAVYWYDDPLRC